MIRLKTLGVLLLLAGSLMLVACGSSSVLEQDQAGLDSLLEAGSDMSKAHPFDFYIYHPEKDGAIQICDQLSAQGFGTSVRERAAGGQALCLAEIPLVPTLENLTAIQATISDLADQLGGEYDGWETVIVP